MLPPMLLPQLTLTLPCHHSRSDSQSSWRHFAGRPYPHSGSPRGLMLLLFTIAHFYTYFFKVNNMIFAVYAARRVHKTQTQQQSNRETTFTF
uniref:MIP22332p n=1 Tax=Drosophila melanogaster TaxID=7227 RepID=D6W4M3_DROME|nr:MIP22332p [Drosophila melanogaster]